VLRISRQSDSSSSNQNIFRAWGVIIFFIFSVDKKSSSWRPGGCIFTPASSSPAAARNRPDCDNRSSPAPAPQAAPPPVLSKVFTLPLYALARNNQKNNHASRKYAAAQKWIKAIISTNYRKMKILIKSRNFS
jgi:hypothetical protein